MKKFNFLKNITLFLGLLILLVGCNNKGEKVSKVEPMKVDFESKEYAGEGFTVNYPSSWEITPNPLVPSQDMFVLDNQDKSSNFLGNVIIQISSDKPEVESVDEYVEEMKKFIESEESADSPLTEFVNVEKVTLSSGEVAKLEAVTTINDLKVKQIQFHVFNKDNLATITYSNLPQNFDVGIEATTYMADTFKFTK
ncbi:hypothetical protein Curi_c08200 [Gottschalkia acidurici 9a]|uniref:Lipoprotein n=1 Tax=Gottschalkia acidurici (strain ATCC 7906 / DSM 604 / BCRC 14475 / CIP 104303 / KCTC 5404 / NCIMB 10678 / 9a) TaxID=1128398 RepID=K0AVN5_GOTA9|nr:hypothetical protein [Gottschalkia acidurici]AFS77893.1 hypothetical protein Curi_c08200 [Gottschalkia acidurici 9a]